MEVHQRSPNACIHSFSLFVLSANIYWVPAVCWAFIGSGYSQVGKPAMIPTLVKLIVCRGASIK